MTNFSKLVLGGVAAIVAISLAHAPAQAAQYSYGSFSPPNAAVPTLAYKAFESEVAKKTGGKITFKLFAGGKSGRPEKYAFGHSRRHCRFRIRHSGIRPHQPAECEHGSGHDGVRHGSRADRRGRG